MELFRFGIDSFSKMSIIMPPAEISGRKRETTMLKLFGDHDHGIGQDPFLSEEITNLSVLGYNSCFLRTRALSFWVAPLCFF